MRLRILVATMALLSLAADAQAAPRLTAFSSCRALVAFAREGALRTGGGVGVVGRAPAGPPDAVVSPRTPVTRDGAVAPTAAEGVGDTAQDFSTTNVQEAGVDEPDVVKTDGRHVFAITEATLRIVDVTGAAPRVVGTLPLAGDGQELLVRGDRVLVIARKGNRLEAPVERPVAPSVALGRPTTLVTEIDVSDPAAPKVARTMEVDGSFVDARQHGATARLVVDAAPEAIVGDVATAVRRAGVSRFVGHTVLRSRLSGRTFTRSLAPCGAIRRPAQFSGLGVLAILTIDLDRGMYSLDRDGVMASAQVVYGSEDSLYVASRRYVRALELGADVPEGTRTEIHRFDISDPSRTVYRATGSVPGFILNSYALSQYHGDLRVASTEEPPWESGAPAGTSSTVTVLRLNGSALTRVGSVGGLGRGERIYAVRFLGDRGFVVTFRQTDPLYALDLSDPTAPTVRGALELPGYSAYLHPVTDTLLLGIGRDGADVKASLFDVSDLGASEQVSTLDLGQGSSPLENEPHAFLYWPAASLAVFPLQSYGTAPFDGAVSLRAGAGAPLAEAGRVVHHSDARGEDAPIERALVIGDRLYTLSWLGLASSRLDTLAPTGFTAF